MNLKRRDSLPTWTERVLRLTRGRARVCQAVLVALAASSACSSRPPTAGATGQITLNWNGVNLVNWQVQDAATHAAVRYTHNSSSVPVQTVDVAPGSYVVVLDGFSEIAPLPIRVTSGQAAGVTPPIGHVTLNWHGVNLVNWQVQDAATHAVLRHSYNSSSVSVQTVDVAPGGYVVVLDGFSEIAPVPVRVTDGQAAAVTPPIGHVTLNWHGVNLVNWQVQDAATHAVVRHTYNSSSVPVQTVDVAPGSYVVVLDGFSEIAPLPVRVTDGQAAGVTPPIGQVSLNWGGPNLVNWQVQDAATRAVVRHTYNGNSPAAVQTVDVAPGNYMVVIDGNPALAPAPVQVVAGSATRVNLK